MFLVLLNFNTSNLKSFILLCLSFAVKEDQMHFLLPITLFKAVVFSLIYVFSF